MKRIGIIFLIAVLMFANGCSLLFGRQGSGKNGGSLLEQLGGKQALEQTEGSDREREILSENEMQTRSEPEPLPTPTPQSTPVPFKNPYNIERDGVDDQTFWVGPEDVLALPDAYTTAYDDITTVYSAPVRVMGREGTINVYAAESIFCTQYVVNYEDMQRTRDDDLALFFSLRDEIQRYMGRDYDRVIKDYEQEVGYAQAVGLFYSTDTGVAYELVWDADETGEIAVGVQVDEDGSGSVWLAYNSYL